VPDAVLRLISSRNWSKVVVLAGAGLSAASGIPTFRGAGGYYQGQDAASLATREGFASNAVLVWNWYAMRISAVRGAEPNDGHRALADLRGVVLTSNVDDLLDRVGVAALRLHGNILEMKGVESGEVCEVNDLEWPEEFNFETLPRLESGELARPNVVWFGEYPWRAPFEVIENLAGDELFVEVGTSGVVSYGFTEQAAWRGCGVIRVNQEARGGKGLVNWTGPSEVILPQLAQLLA
jgi:NAD-dependent deacetylase